MKVTGDVSQGHYSCKPQPATASINTRWNKWRDYRGRSEIYDILNAPTWWWSRIDHEAWLRKYHEALLETGNVRRCRCKRRTYTGRGSTWSVMANILSHLEEVMQVYDEFTRLIIHQFWRPSLFRLLGKHEIMDEQKRVVTFSPVLRTIGTSHSWWSMAMRIKDHFEMSMIFW
jgi:hypothetical protein